MSSTGKDAEKWKFSLSLGMDTLQPFWKIASLQPILKIKCYIILMFTGALFMRTKHENASNSY